jgi:acyl-CoA thioester hydrolase
MPHYRFRLDFDVRDYECDLQGVVNNAVYQHYLEHTRHVFLKQLGIDFAALTQQRINLVVIRVEMDFLYPLRSGDRFYVAVNTERVSRLRFGFVQDIYRVPDDRPILKSRVIGTALNEAGRPCLPKDLEHALMDTVPEVP